MKPLEQKKHREFNKEQVLEVIGDWKSFWMNQTQNNQQDYENYYRRAFGVDANMKYNLAKRIIEEFDPHSSLLEMEKRAKELEQELSIHKEQNLMRMGIVHQLEKELQDRNNFLVTENKSIHSEFDDLTAKLQKSEAALDAIDWHIRRLQNEKVISMQEMTRALKVISDSLKEMRG